MTSNPINSYVSFWTRYYQICSDNNLSISPVGMPFIPRPSGTNFLISLKEPIHLQDWQENSASNNKIDILVHGAELVDPRKAIILQSNVSVNYFDTSEKQARILKPLQSIHYDYKDPEAGHPLFHAQLSEGLIKERDMSDSFKRFELKPPGLDDRLKGMRIPTAHVSLVCILIGLIADHTERIIEEKTISAKGRKKKEHVLRAYVLEKMITEIRKIPRSPLASCDKQSMINDSRKSFSSILWYPEYA